MTLDGSRTLWVVVVIAACAVSLALCRPETLICTGVGDGAWGLGADLLAYNRW